MELVPSAYLTDVSDDDEGISIFINIKLKQNIPNL